MFRTRSATRSRSATRRGARLVVPTISYLHPGLLVDALVLFGWFGLFSLWHFYNRLYTYGHHLDPTAAVKVKPFTPPLFGSQQIANFTVNNYPSTGTYLMLSFTIVLVIAIGLSARGRREPVKA